MAWVEAPRAVSSTARPTRPPCDVLRPSRPAAAQAAANRRLIWSTLRPTTESPGSGETAACRLRTAAAQLPTRRRTSARPPGGSDFERWTVTTTSSPSLKSTSAQQKAATPLRRRAPWNSRGDDRTVDQAAALGGLRALEAAAGAARAEAGGEDGGALVGGEASGLTAAGRWASAASVRRNPSSARRVSGPIAGCLREGARSYAKPVPVKRCGPSAPFQEARTFWPCSRNWPWGPTYL